MAEKIYVVSVGPGSQEYLIPLAQERINKAKYIAGGERNLELVDKTAKEYFIIRNNLTELKGFLAQNISASPVVLASGDAGFYGILKYLKANFPSEMIEVIPGISSIQVAFARLGDMWHDAALFSVHGRPLEDLLKLMILPKVAVLTDAHNSPQAIARLLKEHKLNPSKIAVLNNICYEDEFIWQGTIRELEVLDKELLNSVVVIYNDFR